MADVTMINQHGRAVVMPDTLIDNSILNGCRWPDSTDWRTLNSDSATFRCPRIDPAPPKLGNQPVVVFGAGPSAGADVEGAYRLGVNVRPDGPRYDAVIALDGIYWRKIWRPIAGTRALSKYSSDGPEYGPPHDGVTCHRFWLPLHPLKSQTVRHEKDARSYQVVLAVNGAITTVNITGIAAILVALELTDGPVILTGFDLGEAYRPTQEWKFRVASKALAERVYVHPALTGPVAAMWPEWSAV